MNSNTADDFIKVAVRIRPKIKREIKKEQKDYWGYNGNEVFQLDENGRASQECFTFDYVFGTESKNTDMYKVVRPIVQQATQGINGTVFAYGQTSSGKTHSIMGNEEDIGIIPQAINDIFSHIENNNNNRKFLIRASYIEIYNERINDLLNTSAKDLKIREDIAGNVGVKATEEIARTREELLNVVHEGNKKRQIGETNMNDRSSRSHVIFQIIIESSEQMDGDNQDTPVQVSSLYLVDLAGSERVAQTKATGARLKEGGHINKSLSVLSLVMQQLSLKKEHISFRDSKLTRILSNALGGNSKTLIIATITPVSIENTLSTLMFAKCAKTIMNQPRVNEILSETALIKQHQQKEKMLLRELQNEKEKNITLQMDKNEQDEKIKSLEEKLKSIRRDFVNIKPVPLSKIPKRRHTSAFERPKQEPIIPEHTRLPSIFDVGEINENDYIERAKTPELVDDSMEIVLTPVNVLKARFQSLNESHILLKEFQSDELRISLEHEKELIAEMEKLKNELKTAEEARIKSEKQMKEFQEKYEKRDITCSEVEFELSFLTKKYTIRENELLSKLAEQTNLNEKYKELEREMYTMKREREYMTEIKRCANDFNLQLETLEKESTDLKEQRDQLAKNYAALKEEYNVAISKKKFFMKQVELLTRGVCNGGRVGIQRTSSESAIYKKSNYNLFEHKNESSFGNELIEEVKQNLCSLETIISSRSIEEVSYHLLGNNDNISVCEDLKLMKEKYRNVRNTPEAIEDFDYFYTINERYILECQRLEDLIKELDTKVKVKDQEIHNLNCAIKKINIEKSEIYDQYDKQIKSEVEKYELISKQYEELKNKMSKQSDEMKALIEKKENEIKQKDQDHLTEMNFMKKTVNENGLALEEANIKITSMSSSLQSKEEELVHLRRRLRQSDESKENMEKEMMQKFKIKLDQARHEIDEMSNDLMDKIILIEKLETSLSISQEDVDKLKNKLKSSEQNFQILQQELENTKELWKRNEINYKDFNKEISQLREELKLMQDDKIRNTQQFEDELKKARVEIENFKNMQPPEKTSNDNEIILCEQVKILQEKLDENQKLLLKNQHEKVTLEKKFHENQQHLLKNQAENELQAKILQKKEEFLIETQSEKEKILQEVKLKLQENENLIEKEIRLRQEVESLLKKQSDMQKTLEENDLNIKILKQNLFENNKILEKTQSEQKKTILEKKELIDKIRNNDKIQIELKQKLQEEKENLLKEVQAEKDSIVQELKLKQQNNKDLAEKETFLKQEVETLQQNQNILEKTLKENDIHLKVLEQTLLENQKLLEETQNQKDLVLNEQMKIIQEKEELLENIKNKDEKLVELKQNLYKKNDDLLKEVQKEKDNILQELEIQLQKNKNLFEREAVLKQEVETLRQKQHVLEKSLEENDHNTKVLKQNLTDNQKLLDETRNQKDLVITEQTKTLQEKQELMESILNKDKILIELEKKLQSNENLIKEDFILKTEAVKLHEKHNLLEKSLEEKDQLLGALEQKLLECQDLLKKTQKSKEIILQEQSEILLEKQNLLQKTLEEKDRVLLVLEQKVKENDDLVVKGTLFSKNQSLLEKKQEEKNVMLKELQQKLLQKQEQEVKLKEQIKELQLNYKNVEDMLEEKDRNLNVFKQKLQDYEEIVEKNVELEKVFLNTQMKLKQEEEKSLKNEKIIQHLQEEIQELKQSFERNNSLMDKRMEEMTQLKHSVESKRKVQIDQIQDMSTLEEINKKLLNDLEEKSEMLNYLQNHLKDKEQELLIKIQEIESYTDMNKKLAEKILKLEPYQVMNDQLIERIQLLEQHIKKSTEDEEEQRKTRETNLELHKQLFLYSQEINQLNIKIMQLSSTSSRETELTKKCNELMQINCTLRQQVQKESENVKELNQHLQKTRSELQNLIQNQTISKDCETQIIREKEKVEQQLMTVIVEKNTIESDLKERLSELEQFKIREMEFVEVRHQEKEKIVALEKHLLHVTDECNQLRAEIKNFEITKNQLEIKITRTLKIISDYEKYLNSIIEGNYEHSLNEITESSEQANLQQIITSLIDILQKNEHNLNTLANNVSDKTLEILKNDLKTKQEELNQLKEDNETLDLEVVGFMEILSKRDKEIKELEEKIKELKADNEHLDREVLGALDVIKGLENTKSNQLKEIKHKDDLINKLKKNSELNTNKVCTNCVSLKFRLNSLEKLKLQPVVETLKQEDCLECQKLNKKNKELLIKLSNIQEDFKKMQKTKEHKEMLECQSIVHTEISQSIQRVHDLLSLLRQTKELSGCDCCNSFMRLLVQFHNEINNLRSMPEDLQSLNNTFMENEQRLINLLQKVIETPVIQGIEGVWQQLNEELTTRQADLERYKRTANLRKVFLTEVLYIMNKSESSFKKFYNRLQSNIGDNVSACASCPKSKKFCELIFKIKERVTSTIPILEQTDLPLSSLEYWQGVFAIQDRYILPLQEELSPFQFVKANKNNEEILTELENLRIKYNSLSAVAVLRMEKLKTIVQYFEKEGFKIFNLEQKPSDIKISKNPLQNCHTNENKSRGGTFNLEKARNLGSAVFPVPSKFMKSEQDGETIVKPLKLSDQVKSRRTVYQISDTNNANNLPVTGALNVNSESQK